MDISPGPLHIYGNLGNILSAPGQGQAASVLVPDPNNDRSISLFFQGSGIPDIRCFYAKDKVAGFTGVVPCHLGTQLFPTCNQIPAALSSVNICGLTNTVLGTALTFATATVGVTPNVPIVPFVGYGQFNGQTVVTPGIALDFGYAFGTVVSGSTTVTVSNSLLFSTGQPLVIAGVGNAAGTAPLLTYVSSITDSTHIVIANAPLASLNPAAIGTGNLWPGAEIGPQVPTAAMPYLAYGPGLVADPAQCVQRGLRITGVEVGCTGGVFTVSGYDFYGMAMSEAITVGAGQATGFSNKTFKYITSVIPAFTDAHNYKVGTTDLYGFALRSDFVEMMFASWNVKQIVDGVGWLAGDTTSPATTTTKDVRGQLQVGAVGPLTPITNVAASDGTVVSLAMSGKRLSIAQFMPVSNIVRGQVSDTRTMYGSTQA